MKKRTLSLVLLAALTLPAGAARADSDITVGDVHLHRDAAGVTLSNARIGRSWVQVPIGVPGSPLTTVQTVMLLNGSTPISNQASTEARLTLDGAPITTDQLPLRDIASEALPDGIAVTFRWDLNPQPGTPALLTLRRTVTLHTGTAVLEVRSSLENDAAGAHRLNAFTLDTIGANASSAEVQAYVGGSDWRDDFRHVSTPAVPFDAEGEVARFGTDTGWFFVSERRGGAASRVGADGTSTWAGADYARDILDLGPLASDPPDYNRVENPAYPAPVNGRLLAPHSTLDLGTVATGVYAGGAQQAAAAYVDYLVRFRQPKYHHDVSLNSFHPWSHGVDFNGTTMSREADTVAALGGDQVMLDDQWQGGIGGESGDWQWDPVRFPDNDNNGLPDVVDHIHGLGLKLALWMSPAEFNAASQTFFEHPEWACTPIGTGTGQVPDDAGLGVWDFNNPLVRAHLTNTIARLVRDYGVAEFKFDFQTWVSCPPYDYNDYEMAFASWVDELNGRFPQVSFEFDETNDQRMYAFESVARGASWFDNFHTHKLPDGTDVKKPSQVLHDIWTAAPWIPPSTLGAGVYNDGVGTTYPVDFQMAAAALTHWTFWYDVAGVVPTRGLTAQQFNDTKWWIDWYHAHRDDLGGLVYRLSEDDPWDMTSPAAFQPWSGDHGYLFAFRQSGAAPTAALQGLDASASYTLTNVRTAAALGTFSGATLSAGISIPLSTPFTSAVFSITKN